MNEQEFNMSMRRKEILNRISALAMSRGRKSLWLSIKIEMLKDELRYV